MIFGLWRRETVAAEAEMTTQGAPWMSGVWSNADLGMKQGVRTKYAARDWDPAALELQVAPPETLSALSALKRGEPAERTVLPEAIAVWDYKRFGKIGDILYAGPFLAVRGRLADVFAKHDLGGTRLVPVPIFRDDLATPMEEEVQLLNIGATKHSVRTDLSPGASKFVVDKATGEQLWHLNKTDPDARVVLSEASLSGADLWVERSVHNRLFLSDALAQSIIALGLKDVFRLTPCHVVRGA